MAGKRRVSEGKVAINVDFIGRTQPPGAEQSLAEAAFNVNSDALLSLRDNAC